MKYTVQFFIAGYAAPWGTDVRHFPSLATISDALQDAQREAERSGAGYAPGEAWIWCGELDDVTDQYPDRRAILGPRGGVTFERC